MCLESFDESTNPIDPTEAALPCLESILHFGCLRPAYYGQAESPPGLVLVGMLTHSVFAAIVQAGALRALPQLDLETAQDLRRRQTSHEETSSSGVDDTSPLQQIQHNSSSQQGGSSDVQHVLLRPKKVKSGRSNSAMSLSEDSSASIWDSYDADEEAAVVAMTSAQSFRNKGRSTASLLEGDTEQQASTQPHPQYAQESNSSTTEATSRHSDFPTAQDWGSGIGRDSSSSSRASPQSEQQQTLLQTHDQIEVENNSSSGGGSSAATSWARQTEEDLSPVSPFYM